MLITVALSGNNRLSFLLYARLQSCRCQNEKVRIVAVTFVFTNFAMDIFLFRTEHTERRTSQFKSKPCTGSHSYARPIQPKPIMATDQLMSDSNPAEVHVGSDPFDFFFSIAVKVHVASGNTWQRGTQFIVAAPWIDIGDGEAAAEIGAK